MAKNLNLKYSENDYLYSGMFEDAYDDGLSHQRLRLVKCRKPHICNCGCNQEIAKGEIALLDTGIYEGEPHSWYAKLKCIEDWLEESGQVPPEYREDL